MSRELEKPAQDLSRTTYTAEQRTEEPGPGPLLTPEASPEPDLKLGGEVLQQSDPDFGTGSEGVMVEEDTHASVEERSEYDIERGASPTQSNIEDAADLLRPEQPQTVCLKDWKRSEDM